MYKNKHKVVLVVMVTYNVHLSLHKLLSVCSQDTFLKSIIIELLKIFICYNLTTFILLVFPLGEFAEP